MTFPRQAVTLLVSLWATALVLTSGAHGAELLRYAGATSLQRDFMPDAAHKFEAHNGVKFHIEGGNTAAGISALRTGKADIAGSGRFLTAQEKADGLVETLIGWDALVVVVHASNPIENISLDDLRRMVSGEIHNWQQIGGIDLPILQVAAPAGSGIRDSVEQLLLPSGRHIPAQSIVSMVTSDADRNVAQLPAAFTITSMSMVDAEGIKTITLNEVTPGNTTIAADEYPLLKPLLLVTKGQPREKLALFIAFAKSPEGQAIIRKKFYPLARP